MTANGTILHYIEKLCWTTLSFCLSVSFLPPVYLFVVPMIPKELLQFYYYPGKQTRLNGSVTVTVSFSSTLNQSVHPYLFSSIASVVFFTTHTSCIRQHLSSLSNRHFFLPYLRSHVCLCLACLCSRFKPNLIRPSS